MLIPVTYSPPSWPFYIADLVRRDPRMVERKKTGLAKARKRVRTSSLRISAFGFPSYLLTCVYCLVAIVHLGQALSSNGNSMLPARRTKERNWNWGGRGPERSGKGIHRRPFVAGHSGGIGIHLSTYIHPQRQSISTVMFAVNAIDIHPPFLWATPQPVLMEPFLHRSRLNIAIFGVEQHVGVKVPPRIHVS